MNSIFLTGTAGSGKSQLTSILANTILENNKEVIVVNLDPGVNNLPYSSDIDIRDFISINEIMDKYNLGPNGAVILAAELIALKIGEINEFEILRAPSNFISNEINATVTIYSEDDDKKYDPKLKSNHAKPFKPAIYIE